MAEGRNVQFSTDVSDPFQSNTMKTKNSNRMSRAFVKVAAPLRRWSMAVPKDENTSPDAFISGEWIFVSALNGFVDILLDNFYFNEK